MGPKKQDFGPTIDILKGNHSTLYIHLVKIRQKLGIILGDKMLQRLKLSKICFYKKGASKLLSLIERKLERFQ